MSEAGILGRSLSPAGSTPEAAAPAVPAAIRLSGLRKRFAAGAPPALDDVALEVRTGEVFGIVGRSGAGKSTLIRCVNLLERPEAGLVAWPPDDGIRSLA